MAFCFQDPGRSRVLAHGVREAPRLMKEMTVILAVQSSLPSGVGLATSQPNRCWHEQAFPLGKDGACHLRLQWMVERTAPSQPSLDSELIFFCESTDMQSPLQQADAILTDVVQVLLDKGQHQELHFLNTQIKAIQLALLAAVFKKARQKAAQPAVDNDSTAPSVRDSCSLTLVNRGAPIRCSLKTCPTLPTNEILLAMSSGNARREWNSPHYGRVANDSDPGLNTGSVQESIEEYRHLIPSKSLADLTAHELLQGWNNVPSLYVFRLRIFLSTLGINCHANALQLAAAPIVAKTQINGARWQLGSATRGEDLGMGTSTATNIQAVEKW
ncbi:hypothetical protein F5I97DRAFT_2006586 [Phlebopus sp. FC_14]|nr:hypothetical protein F5I97DRAFT_2006586 [Phlebopus sp. FC_14]